MSLSEEQKSTISQWVASGKSIADIQKLLKENFSLSYTYMEVRFLVDDLDIVYEESEPEEEKDSNHSEETEAEAQAQADIIDADVVEGAVCVDVDAVIRPGSLVSGSVTFSDGEKLSWQLTSTGQLGLIPGANPDYRPSNEDLQSFQSQLQSVLQEKGF